MEKVAFANAKGGVAKTTSVVSVGAALAREGRRTLLIDLDTQGQVTKSLGVHDDDALGLADLIEGEADLNEVQLKARENLDVITGGRALAGVKRLVARRDMRAEMVLAEVLEGLNGYEYVLFDTAPSWDILNVNCLFAADAVVIPVSMEALAVQGLNDFLAGVRDVQKYRSDLEFRGVIPTFYDKRVRKSAEVLEQLRQHFGDKVLPTVRYNVRLSEAPAFGETIFEYDPRANGAADYEALAEAIAASSTRKEQHEQA